MSENHARLRIYCCFIHVFNYEKITFKPRSILSPGRAIVIDPFKYHRSKDFRSIGSSRPAWRLAYPNTDRMHNGMHRPDNTEKGHKHSMSDNEDKMGNRFTYTATWRFHGILVARAIFLRYFFCQAAWAVFAGFPLSSGATNWKNIRNTEH